MEIPDIVNIKNVRWSDGTRFGSRIIKTTETGILYFTIDWWNFLCEPDPDHPGDLVITHKLPRHGMFTSKIPAFNRKGDTL